MDHESEIQPKGDHPQRSPEQVGVRFETKKAKCNQSCVAAYSDCSAGQNKRQGLSKTLCKKDPPEDEKETDERQGMREVSAGRQYAAKPGCLKKDEVDQEG